MRNYIYGNIDGEKANTMKFHRDLLDAISKKDGNRAHAVIKGHLERTREIYDRHMKPEFN